MFVLDFLDRLYHTSPCLDDIFVYWLNELIESKGIKNYINVCNKYVNYDQIKIMIDNLKPLDYWIEFRRQELTMLEIYPQETLEIDPISIEKIKNLNKLEIRQLKLRDLPLELYRLYSAYDIPDDEPTFDE